MGGLAFSQTSAHDGSVLYIPRMGPEVYHELKAVCCAVLMQWFAFVQVPPETPGKDSHGDIDFIVSQPSDPKSVNELDLRRVLGAEYSLQAGPGMWSFAVPLPHSASVRQPSKFDVSTKYTSNMYAQVDVQHCISLEKAKWQVFKDSYGDAWQILGTMIRPLGLLADHDALHVMIEEIEFSPAGKKASRIFLTSDVDECMRFLGLDADRFHAGFASVEEVYEWAIDTPLFAASKLVQPKEEQERVMTANDRQRNKKRPMYRSFKDDFLPQVQQRRAQLPEAQRSSSVTRESILKDALETFDIQQEYDTRMAEHRKRERESTFDKKLAEALPYEGQDFHIVVRGLKQFLVFDSDGRPRLQTLQDKQGSKAKLQAWTAGCSVTDDELLAYILEHAETARARELERNQTDMTRRMAERKVKVEPSDPLS